MEELRFKCLEKYKNKKACETCDTYIGNYRGIQIDEFCNNECLKEKQNLLHAEEIKKDINPNSSCCDAIYFYENNNIDFIEFKDIVADTIEKINNKKKLEDFPTNEVLIKKKNGQTDILNTIHKVDNLEKFIKNIILVLSTKLLNISSKSVKNIPNGNIILEIIITCKAKIDSQIINSKNNRRMEKLLVYTCDDFQKYLSNLK
ncbi:MAG: hypothetical protein PHY80_03385 [Rickettsiales bacterium]|nr:hypothetical protein [Rickettsiales bacterium]